MNYSLRKVKLVELENWSNKATFKKDNSYEKNEKWNIHEWYIKKISIKNWIQLFNLQSPYLNKKITWLNFDFYSYNPPFSTINFIKGESIFLKKRKFWIEFWTNKITLKKG